MKVIIINCLIIVIGEIVHTKPLEEILDIMEFHPNALVDKEIRLNLEEDSEYSENQLIQPAGISYVNTIEGFQRLGINVSDIEPDIIQDALLPVPDLARKHGYKIESHTVTTHDGYVLTIHRIPGKPSFPFPKKKQPVFLMHGLLASSACWIVMRPEISLAYALSDLGYDVWMGNARGNMYSRKHISLNPDGKRSERKQFWEFSWHEIGYYDLPAMIDYTLAKTGFKKVHYIGHSQGTTSFFVMASERPDYNDKILSMQALAPIAFMSNLRSAPIRFAVNFLEPLQALFNTLGIFEFLPPKEFIDIVTIKGCNDMEDEKSLQLCKNLLFAFGGGYNSERINQKMIPVLLGHLPAGASTNQIVHYGQEIKSGAFRQFDWGTLSNYRRYGTRNPPNYNLKNIRAPVALHYSENDVLAEPIDVEQLYASLPNVISKILIPDPKFTHLDFIVASDLEKLVYDRMFNIMKLVEQGLRPE